jgi:Icc-related predicted phosphoesterase
MKIAVGSDLHLEIGSFVPENPGADVLVLAGDILVAADLHEHPRPLGGELPVNLGRRQAAAYAARDFLAECSQRFEHVVMVAGNHEFYHGRWIRTLEILRTETSHWPNIHFLERDSVEINGVRFLGATKWTDLQNGDPVVCQVIQDGMNDYRVIRHDGADYRRLRPSDSMRRFQDTMTWMKAELESRPSATTVVVTHHAPTAQSVNSKYRGDYLMNPAYHSNVSELILDHPQIQCWIHGHMHDASDYMVGTTRVVANPRGYVGYERDSHSRDPYHFQVITV